MRLTMKLSLYDHAQQLKFVYGAAAWALATPLAYAFYYDFAVPATALATLVPLTLGLALVKVAALSLTGQHKQSWSQTSFQDLFGLARTVLGVTALVAPPLFILVIFMGWPLPVTALPLEALLALGLMVGARAVVRAFYEHRWRGRGGVNAPKDAPKRVLVAGAGEAGALVVRELLRHPEMGLQPVGFLDDNPRKRKATVASLPVLGSTHALDEVARAVGADELLIAIPSADGAVVRRLVRQALASDTGIAARIVPGMYELLSGRVTISRIRNVEIEDLLRRPPITLDTSLIATYVTDRTVMVTGAGGSIGSELVRQLCRFRPRALILFGHGENSIYQLERELDSTWPDVPYDSVIGAIQNGRRLEHIFERFRPEVVFHAAAHKHVPLMELNPEEAIFNNVIGSRNLVNLALKYGVGHFINISTDKAVNPSSVMGASKRMVEHVVQSAAGRAGPEQVFVSVRFGNVLGSRGSVIPLFKQQIQAGGPVIVTHPEMVRYFMTIPEAAQLVLQAAAQGRNQEVYILDMGEPVKILELARDLIRLSGFEPEVDIPIVFSGVRPGEKLFEELMTTEERASATAHAKIFVAKPAPFDEAALEATLVDLTHAALCSDAPAVRRLLRGFVQGCHISLTANDRTGGRISDRVTAPLGTD